jgi:hypothetical protein
VTNALERILLDLDIIGGWHPAMPRLTWKEFHGQRVRPRRRHGFGSGMIVRRMADGLEGRAETDRRSDGIVLTTEDHLAGMRGRH